MNPVCVFVGPTLTVESARQTLHALYLPPARQGDVYRASRRYRPRIIGIVDGYFQQAPSVWHYAQRNYPSLLDLGRKHALPNAELKALRTWLENTKPNQKRDDAVAMLKIMRTFTASAKQVAYHFEHTTMWDDLIRQNPDNAQVANELSEPKDGILDELRLQPQLLISIYMPNV